MPNVPGKPYDMPAQDAGLIAEGLTEKLIKELCDATESMRRSAAGFLANLQLMQQLAVEQETLLAGSCDLTQNSTRQLETDKRAFGALISFQSTSLANSLTIYTTVTNSAPVGFVNSTVGNGFYSNVIDGIDWSFAVLTLPFRGAKVYANLPADTGLAGNVLHIDVTSLTAQQTLAWVTKWP